MENNSEIRDLLIEVRNTVRYILFLILTAAVAGIFLVISNSALGETAVCMQKNADTLRICTSLKVDSEIARGNEAAVLARKALYALRNGEDPEVFVPLLAGWLVDADLTLKDFGATKMGLAAVINRYYATKARALNIFAMAKRGEGNKAFRETRLIYEKESAMLAIVKTNFAPYPIRLIADSSTR